MATSRLLACGTPFPPLILLDVRRSADRLAAVDDELDTGDVAVLAGKKVASYGKIEVK
jgi:hypothetical protein